MFGTEGSIYISKYFFDYRLIKNYKGVLKLEQVLQVVISGLLSGGIYSLVSVGVALIFGVVALVNFAHGEYLMIAMYVSFWIFTLTGLDPYQSMLLNLVVMTFIGFITFKVIMQRVLYADHEIQILITLGVSMILQNAALMFFKADFRNVRIEISNKTFDLFGLTFSSPRVIAFFIAIGASILLYLFLQKTYTGTAMRAISQNNKAAQLMGIKLTNTYMLAFVLGIILVGLGGVLIVPMYPAFPTVGDNFILPAFVVVVIGGLSSVPGAIIGGLLVGVIESLTAYFIGPEFQQAAYFLLLILVVIFKPNGLLGQK